MIFTIVGAGGFVGSRLAEILHEKQYTVQRLDRRLSNIWGDLGHVIDCAGLTADFRTRSSELFESHLSRVDRLISELHFESYLYLSSTRLYKDSRDTSELSPLIVNPSEFDDSYNISKIAGESACLIRNNPAIRVARLSNVLGLNPDPAVFVTSLVEEALANGHVQLRESLGSSKDYIDLDDACRYLEAIAVSGQHRIYNVAHGRPLTHAQILEAMQREIEFSFEAPSHPTRAFPIIDTDRLTREFGPPHKVPEDTVREVCRRLAAEHLSRNG